MTAPDYAALGPAQTIGFLLSVARSGEQVTPQVKAIARGGIDAIEALDTRIEALVDDNEKLRCECRSYVPVMDGANLPTGYYTKTAALADEGDDR